MYYYGQGGYTQGNTSGCNAYAYPIYTQSVNNTNTGYNAAIILVLFILLVIILGSKFGS